MTTGQTISLIVSIVFGAFILIGMLIGLKRGLKKSIIRFITIAVAIILTFVLTGLLSAAVSNIKLPIDGGKTISEAITDAVQNNEALSSFMNDTPILADAVGKLPALITTLISFIIVFLNLKLITFIVYFILSRALPENLTDHKVKMGAGKRLGGAAIHGVSIFLCLAMIMLPLLGFTSVCNRDDFSKVAASFAGEGDEKGISDAEVVVYDTVAFNVYRTIQVEKLGRAYLNNVAKVTDNNGEQIPLMDELEQVVHLLAKGEEKGFLSKVTSGDTEQIVSIFDDEQYTYEFAEILYDSHIVRDTLPSLVTLLMRSVGQSSQIPEEILNPSLAKVSGSLRNAFAKFDNRESNIKMIAGILSSIGSVAGIGDAGPSALILMAGKLLGGFQGNADLKEAFDGMIDILTEMPAVSDALGQFGDIKEVLKNGDITKIAETAAASADIFKYVMEASESGEGLNPEDTVGLIEKIAQNVDKDTVENLKSVLNEDLLTSMGMSGEGIDDALDVMFTVLDEFAAADGKDSYAAEADAINNIVCIAMTGGDGLNTDSIETIFNSAKDSSLIGSTLDSISDKGLVLFDAKNSGEADNIADTINKLYEEGGKTGGDAEILLSLAKMLNIEDKVNIGR